MKTINVISLARCHDRREKMVRQFSCAGLPYNMIDAVDGKSHEEILEYEVDFEAYRKLYKKDIRAGEIGCYASHLKTLDYICATENDYGIVMEDDVLLVGDFLPSRISAIIEGQIAQLPEDWAMIYPGNPLMWAPHRYAGISYKGLDPGAVNQSHTGKLSQLSMALIGTQCYIISVRFAQHILHHWNTVYRPIDEVYRYLSSHSMEWKFFHAPKSQWWCCPNFKVPSEITRT